MLSEQLHIKAPCNVSTSLLQGIQKCTTISLKIDMETTEKQIKYHFIL